MKKEAKCPIIFFLMFFLTVCFLPSTLSAQNVQDDDCWMPGVCTSEPTDNTGPDDTDNPVPDYTDQPVLDASHSAENYVPGTDLTVTMRIDYTGILGSLGVDIELPEGWVYVQDSVGGDDPPLTSEFNSMADFFWTYIPSDSLEFTYRVRAPEGASGQKRISASVSYSGWLSAEREINLPAISVFAEPEMVLEASHSAGNYMPGTDLTVTMGIQYTGTLLSLGVEVELPEGWVYVQDSVEGDDPPLAGELNFFWIDIPSDPVEFTYRVRVPEEAYGQRQISARVLYYDMSLTESEISVPAMTVFPDVSYATIHGIIRDRKTGVPLNKAAVKARCVKGGCSGQKKVKTDASGYYEFSDLEDGKWKLIVKAEGYTKVKKGVYVEGGVYEKDIVLKRQ